MVNAHLDVGVGFKKIGRGLSPAESGYAQQMRQTSQQLVATLKSIVNQFDAVTEDIMIEALEPTFAKSQEYVPVLTGELKASGYLQKTGSGSRKRVEIGYGRGGQPRYAAIVHERTDIPHAKGKQAKFLQRAVMEDLDGIHDRIVFSLRRWARWQV